MLSRMNRESQSALAASPAARLGLLSTNPANLRRRHSRGSWLGWIPTLLIVATLTSCSGAADLTSEDALAGTDTSRPTLQGTDTPLEMASLPPYVEPTPGASIERLLELHTIQPDRPRTEVITYRVKQGDTLFDIADKYGLQPETMLWGNYDTLKDTPESLRPDQKLNILPTDGVYYKWQDGDTLEGVAAKFKVTPDDIIEWPGNDLAGFEPNEIAIDPGTWLVVPGGKRDIVSWQAPRITRSNPAVARYVGPGACGSVYSGPIGEGSFIWPTTLKYLSGNPYSSIHPAIDIAGAIGNAVFASASGVVVYAGWNDWGYGYMIVIDHGDGWQTLYAHLSAINVGCGQGVRQGAVIGGVGSTGNSTGPHLHFEMQSDLYGKVNPYNFVSP